MGSAAQLRAAAQVCQRGEDEDQQGGEEEYWAVIGQLKQYRAVIGR